MNSAIRAAGLSEFAAVCAQRQAHRNGWCCRGAAVALPGCGSLRLSAPQLAIKSCFACGHWADDPPRTADVRLYTPGHRVRQ